MVQRNKSLIMDKKQMDLEEEINKNKIIKKHIEICVFLCEFT